jgi:biopolymer transport protein ExbD
MQHVMSYRGAMQIHRRRRQMYKDAFQVQPMREINTTPLIDVMLVLLIMIMITLPISTHSIPIDLPAPGVATGEEPRVDRLDIARNGALRWNGLPVSMADARARLDAHVADPGNPVLHMKADELTSYDVFDRTLALVKTAGVTRLGFVDNLRKLDW